MSSSKQTRFDFSKASVLMVDASPICLEVLTIILSGFGFRRMHRVSDFKSATEIVKIHAIDLMFLDPYPHGPSGYDFVKWVRSEKLGQNSSAPIILMTSNPHVRVVSSARECGADFVVAKPFSTAIILDRIAWVVENEARRGELMAPATLVSTTGSGVDLW